MYLKLQDHEGEVALEQLTLDGLRVAKGLAEAFLNDCAQLINDAECEEA